jgi:hypothetical protein
MKEQLTDVSEVVPEVVDAQHLTRRTAY